MGNNTNALSIMAISLLLSLSIMGNSTNDFIAVIDSCDSTNAFINNDNIVIVIINGGDNTNAFIPIIKRTTIITIL